VGGVGVGGGERRALLVLGVKQEGGRGWKVYCGIEREYKEEMKL